MATLRDLSDPLQRPHAGTPYAQYQDIIITFLGEELKCRIAKNLGVDASIKVNGALGAPWGCSWGVLGFKFAFRYEYCTFWGVIIVQYDR